MALWGKTDALVSAPKFITRKATFDAQAAVSSSDDTINLLNSNTNFATGDGVVYTGASGIGLTQGTSYYVKKVDAATIQLTPTEAGSKTGATGINLTAGATGAIGYLQRNVEGNEATGATGVGDHNYNGKDLIFVDADEAAQASNRARGIKHAGWWLYRTWTNADGSVAHHAENVVAMGSYAGATGVGTYQAQTGDSDDDSILVDGTITITAQPEGQSVTAPNTATFDVAATLAGAGTLSYQWQKRESNGAPSSWANVGTDSNTYTTGVTAVTAGAGATNGDFYRVVISSTDGTGVISNIVTLTVTA